MQSIRLAIPFLMVSAFAMGCSGPAEHIAGPDTSLYRFEGLSQSSAVFQCTNSDTDVPGIQSVIDGSAPGARIVIGGTCKITSKIWIRRSNITISGMYDDANRNGPDAADFKTEMLGSSAVSPYTASSDAFVIAPAPGAGDDPAKCVNTGNGADEHRCNGVTHDVTIENIRFFQVQRAINVVGGHEHDYSIRVGGCDYTATMGSVTNITVRNNYMNNVRRAVQVEGRSRNILIDGNVVDGTGENAFPIFSEWVGCDAAPVGPVEHYTLSNNRTSRVSGRAVALQGPGRHFEIRNNALASSGNGFFNCPRTWQQDGVMNIVGNTFTRENVNNADVYISAGTCASSSAATTSSNIKIMGNDFRSAVSPSVRNVRFEAGTFGNVLVTGKNRNVSVVDDGTNTALRSRVVVVPTR